MSSCVKGVGMLPVIKGYQFIFDSFMDSVLFLHLKAILH